VATTAGRQELFQPGCIGEVTFKNRIAMPPMGTNLVSEDSQVTDRLPPEIRPSLILQLGYFSGGRSTKEETEEDDLREIPPSEGPYKTVFVIGHGYRYRVLRQNQVLLEHHDAPKELAFDVCNN
jgi:hypothetical protein